MRSPKPDPQCGPAPHALWHPPGVAAFLSTWACSHLPCTFFSPRGMRGEGGQAVSMKVHQVCMTAKLLPPHRSGQPGCPEIGHRDPCVVLWASAAQPGSSHCGGVGYWVGQVLGTQRPRAGAPGGDEVGQVLGSAAWLSSPHCGGVGDGVGSGTKCPPAGTLPAGT